MSCLHFSRSNLINKHVMLIGRRVICYILFFLCFFIQYSRHARLFRFYWIHDLFFWRNYNITSFSHVSVFICAFITNSIFFLFIYVISFYVFQCFVSCIHPCSALFHVYRSRTLSYVYIAWFYVLLCFVVYIYRSSALFCVYGALMLCLINIVLGFAICCALFCVSVPSQR